ncbi:MAG TPA: hypothetical protein VHA10_11125 [Hypericibacter adhaerens]|jgi:hypothetical protein|uniref:Lipoprotein n=1 Tax=Hypericibacter adhaerens TaxID=2602016 RepID=A0A5J6N7V4_9PROT|nr:hypothetical protein [Hypericibacter adhaerens]QEX24993.1 hypothetical protein FRZ61_49370 [Hypericibacter adhaerens]HWA43754.1 hypothetical protein [Hypericibacter adhaerens]
MRPLRALALLAGMALAACADDTPPPAPSQVTGPGQSANTTAYDSLNTVPMGSQPAQPAAPLAQQPLAPAPPPQNIAPPANPDNTPGAPSIPQGAGGIYLPVTARFLIDRPQTIEVSIRDAQPADRVQLVAPDGSVIDAYQLDREFIQATESGPSGFNMGVGVSGGSSSGVQPSFGIGFPIFGSAPRSPQRDEVQTKALIRVADMAAYRANWQKMVLRMYMGEKSVSPRKMEMAAPAPPS